MLSYVEDYTDMLCRLLMGVNVRVYATQSPNDPWVKEKKVFMTVIFFLLWRCILYCIGQETVWQYASYPRDRSGPAAIIPHILTTCPSWVLTAYEPSAVASADYPATWYSSPEKPCTIT